MTTAREITLALGGRWCGGYGIARCPCHDDTQPSLSVRDSDGDILVKCHAGCDWREVKDALRDKGLLPDRNGTATPPDPAIRAHREAERRADERKRTEAARSIWRQSGEADGTPVETYLRSRGINLDIPPTIRFAMLRHGPTGLELPAMVAAVQGPDGAITGVHRTFLKIDGSGKAPLTQAKMMLGICRGGAVRFGKAVERLGIGEGIESCLSVAQECPDLPVWAALSTSGLKTVAVPPEVREIVILADNDLAGDLAAQEAATRFLREGRDPVRIARPIGEDFNVDLQLPDNVVALRRRGANV